MDQPLKSKDPKTYTVHGLLAAGSRFTDDFEPEDAVRMYLELHPEAVEADVRAELKAEMKKRGRHGHDLRADQPPAGGHAADVVG